MLHNVPIFQHVIAFIERKISFETKLFFFVAVAPARLSQTREVTGAR